MDGAIQSIKQWKLIVSGVNKYRNFKSYNFEANTNTNAIGISRLFIDETGVIFVIALTVLLHDVG